MKSRYRWTILAVGVFTTAALSALRQGLPALGPALRDAYGLSLPETGLVLSSVTFGIVLTLLAWGVLTDRIGERPVLAIGLTGTAIALTFTAYAHGAGALLAGLAAAGMLGASATNASGRAVMGWFPRSERGMALGVRQMAIPLGGGVAALALPALAAGFGLRGAFLALAAGCLVAAIVAARWMREPPPAPAGRPVVQAPPPVRDRRLWRLGTGSALLVVAQSGILAFLVVFLHEQRGMSIAAAAATLAAVQFGGALARVAAGRWSDRRDARVDPVRRLGMAAAIALAASAALSALSAPLAALVPALVAAGVLAMSWNGLSFTAAAEMSGRDRAGTAIGIQNTLLSLAGVVAPVGFGATATLLSWPAAYAALAVSQLAGWLVLRPLVGEEDARRERRLARRRAAALPGPGGVARRPGAPIVQTSPPSPAHPVRETQRGRK